MSVSGICFPSSFVNSEVHCLFCLFRAWQTTFWISCSLGTFRNNSLLFTIISQVTGSLSSLFHSYFGGCLVFVVSPVTMPVSSSLTPDADCSSFLINNCFVFISFQPCLPDSWNILIVCSFSQSLPSGHVLIELIFKDARPVRSGCFLFHYLPLFSHFPLLGLKFKADC